jgi:hypothetical protein
MGMAALPNLAGRWHVGKVPRFEWPQRDGFLAKRWLNL